MFSHFRFEDARSIAAKLALAVRTGVGGVGVWTAHGASASNKVQGSGNCFGEIVHLIFGSELICCLSLMFVFENTQDIWDQFTKYINPS